jgi:hypothetical protein
MGTRINNHQREMIFLYNANPGKYLIIKPVSFICVNSDRASQRIINIKFHLPTSRQQDREISFTGT